MRVFIIIKFFKKVEDKELLFGPKNPHSGFIQRNEGGLLGLKITERF